MQKHSLSPMNFIPNAWTQRESSLWYYSQRIQLLCWEKPGGNSQTGCWSRNLWGLSKRNKVSMNEQDKYYYNGNSGDACPSLMFHSTMEPSLTLTPPAILIFLSLPLSFSPFFFNSTWFLFPFYSTCLHMHCMWRTSNKVNWEPLRGGAQVTLDFMQSGLFWAQDTVPSFNSQRGYLFISFLFLSFLSFSFLVEQKNDVSPTMLLSDPSEIQTDLGFQGDTFQVYPKGHFSMHVFSEQGYPEKSTADQSSIHHSVHTGRWGLVKYKGGRWCQSWLRYKSSIIDCHVEPVNWAVTGLMTFSILLLGIIYEKIPHNRNSHAFVYSSSIWDWAMYDIVYIHMYRAKQALTRKKLKISSTLGIEVENFYISCIPKSHSSIKRRCSQLSWVWPKTNISNKKRVFLRCALCLQSIHVPENNL